jgi:DNA-binding MarR family transcriptional regulator/GNAT superfamily N-acetyltransferase
MGDSQAIGDDAIGQVRSFNRTIAQRIGALDEKFLDRRRPMNESRLLWEVGPEGAEVRELRNRLRLDPGYLTRLVQSLEAQKLVRVQQDAEDRRVRRVSLTRAGLRERHEIDRRSDALAANILEVIPTRRREELVSAMAFVERCFEASMIEFHVADPASAEVARCFQHYFDDLNARFESGFDPACSISADPDELKQPRGLVLIARVKSEAVACGALKFSQPGIAELKRMWVSPRFRGLGLGRRLLDRLERSVLAEKRTIVRLETNRTLPEAIGLYRAAGYAEVAPFNTEKYAHHWFEKKLGMPRKASAAKSELPHVSRRRRSGSAARS